MSSTRTLPRKLRVAPAGGRWWRFKYRFANKERRISLGVPVLKDAWGLARDRACYFGTCVQKVINAHRFKTRTGRRPFSTLHLVQRAGGGILAPFRLIWIKTVRGGIGGGIAAIRYVKSLIDSVA
jgi:hypothetical protein